MRQLISATCLTIALLAMPATAQETTDDIVRLPGKGLLKDRPGPAFNANRPKKLLPAGGLMMTFDINDDGFVTRAELAAGTAAAFQAADSNQDGNLSALEQQDWAHSLPTWDDTLLNPVQFNPNLDSIVSEEEFASVINQLAESYSEEQSGRIRLANLAVEDRRADRFKQPTGRNGPPTRRDQVQ